MKSLPAIKVDACPDVAVTPPRIVLVTCEECGCSGGKVADAKPAACQFCGRMPRRWWQGVFEGGAPSRRQRRAAR